MREIRGINGAAIVINPAPFKLVKQLRGCIANELKKIQIDIGNPESLDAIKKEFNGNVSKYLNYIKDILLNLETSENFERVIWDCLKECLYDNKSITQLLFDDIPAAREDYDLIVYECIKENMAPFFKSLGGMLSTLKVSTESVQE